MTAIIILIWTLALIINLLPVIFAIIPVVYKAIKKKETYSNKEALKFLGKMLLICLAVEFIFSVVYVMMDASLAMIMSSVAMFFWNIFVTTALMTISFRYLTKGNGETYSAIHVLGKIVAYIVEFICVVVGAFILRYVIIDVLLKDVLGTQGGGAIGFLIILILYIVIRIFFFGESSIALKMKSKKYIKEAEANGISFCPECGGSVPADKKFCPKCHHKM